MKSSFIKMKAFVRNVSASTALLTREKMFYFCGAEFLYFDTVLINFVWTLYRTKFSKSNCWCKKKLHTYFIQEVKYFSIRGTTVLKKKHEKQSCDNPKPTFRGIFVLQIIWIFEVPIYYPWGEKKKKRKTGITT